MLLADEPVTLHNMSTFSRPPELKDLINHLAKGGIIDNQTSKDWINIANQNGDTAADSSARFAEIIHGAAGAIFSNDNNGIDMTEIYEQNACILVIINAQSYADFAYELGPL